MKKEILLFDEQGLNESVLRLNSMSDKLKKLYSALETLTGGEVQLITKTELDERLLKGSNYKNAELVAQLLNVSDEYKFYITNYDKVDERLFDDNFNIKTSVLTELREKHTSYMTESATKHYRDMQKIADILNTKPSGFEQVIQKNGLGYTINKGTLNNITQMYERSN